MSRRTRHSARELTRARRSRRRNSVAIAAVLAIVVLIVIGAVRRGGVRRSAVYGNRPNVLLITIDTLRWDHVGCYGSNEAVTPVLDGLAARGARFETAIAHAPLTAPSHASILTGLTPLRHGVRDNGAFELPAGLMSMPVVFKSAGYATAGFISGFPLDRRFGFANGFDTYDDRLPRGSTARRAAETDRRADLTTNSVLEWLDRRRPAAGTQGSADTPWFVWVHYFDPHAPYDPPPEFRSRFAARPYDGEIAFVDAQVGRLLQRLQQIDALDHTIVLATADHGESLGEHGEDTHGVFIYDATVRVPLIAAGPGVEHGIVPTVVARGVDILPTALDLAGLGMPADLDGRSLKPALLGGAVADEPAYVESLLARRHLGWAPLHGLRDARWKFIQAPRSELYDLAADAGERVNRTTDTDARDRAASMARQLAAQMAAGRTPSTERSSDRDTGERLRALGYLSSSPVPAHDATNRDPKDGIALINRLERAIATIRTDPRTAAAELRSVLAEDPSSNLARRQLAVALSAVGDHRGAIEQVRVLTSRNAASADDLLLLSESLRVIGRPDEASRILDEAERLDPRSPEAALTIARARMAAGDPTGAAAAYRRALDRAPDHPEALVGIGNVAFAQGDTDAAAAGFERVLARDPEDLGARTGLGLVRGRQGRMTEAVRILEHVVRDAPGNADALAGLAAALARTGQPAAAVPYFERAVSAGLKTPPVLNGLGFAKLETGDRRGALTALRASLAIKPDQPRIEQAIRDLSAESTGPRLKR